MNESPSSEATAEFERDLMNLLATAFGRGAIVEGTRELAVPVSDTPAWTVTIERREPSTESSYRPELLEE